MSLLQVQPYIIKRIEVKPLQKLEIENEVVGIIDTPTAKADGILE